MLGNRIAATSSDSQAAGYGDARSSHAPVDIDRRLQPGLGFISWRTAFAPMQLRQQREQASGRAVTHRPAREDAMKTLAFAGALMGSLLAATALTPGRQPT